MVHTDEVCAPCPRRPGNEGSRSKPRPGSEKLCFEPHGPGHHVRLGPLTLSASVSPAVKGGQWQAAGGLGRRKGVCGAVRTAVGLTIGSGCSRPCWGAVLSSPLWASPAAASAEHLALCYPKTPTVSAASRLGPGAFRSDDRVARRVQATVVTVLVPGLVSVGPGVTGRAGPAGARRARRRGAPPAPRPRPCSPSSARSGVLPGGRPRTPSELVFQ